MTRTNGASGGGGQQQASGKLPRKRFYRARAHSNPLSDSHFPVPVSPDEFDLSEHYPRYFPADKGSGEEAPPPRIRFADVGCGFGGLLVGLSPLFPDTLMIGMELRDKVFARKFCNFSLLSGCLADFPKLNGTSSITVKKTHSPCSTNNRVKTENSDSAERGQRCSGMWKELKNYHKLGVLL
jgi:tRNA (guanine-N7-)-methyltransferase